MSFAQFVLFQVAAPLVGSGLRQLIHSKGYVQSETNRFITGSQQCLSLSSGRCFKRSPDERTSGVKI
ncbi:hypothetical protein CEXT_327441 [Caerostris extrusa]|uniref:Secreted protein n=1 Tax=Caerostris extrusa TaxID=172846 RepID=A0AAV4XHI5_CAEEX|nr:hypothetical protein CEXT_327441 [Caerostris extrusa]